MKENNMSFFLFVCFSPEKETPISVKQEPAEFKEPAIEADRYKSRYKKFIPPVPPSPVSRSIFGLK